MRRLLMLCAAFSVMGAAGCRTLRSDGQSDSVPVATWFGLATTDPAGRAALPVPDEQIVAALRRVGIEASVDATGLHVPAGQEDQAREALLTDTRLKESGVLVIVAVPAGTGRRTADGVMFTVATPTTMPATVSIVSTQVQHDARARDSWYLASEAAQIRRDANRHESSESSRIRMR